MEGSNCRIKISVGAVTFEIEGPEAFVSKGLDFIKENIPLTQLQEAAMRPSITVGAEEAVSPVPTEMPSLTDFYNQKRPTTDIQRVTLFIYYLRESKGLPEASHVEVGPLFNEVMIKKPKDVIVAIRNAAKSQYGWLELGSKPRYYKVTNAGENLVRYILPEGKKASK